MSGRVYFVQAGEGGPIKIGWTGGSPSARMAALQTGNPHRLRLLTSIEGTAADEAALHARFADSRLEGEWFAPSADLRAYLLRLDCDVFGASRADRPRWEGELLVLARRMVQGGEHHAGIEGNRGLVTWIARCTADLERRDRARERFCADFAAVIGLLAEAS